MTRIETKMRLLAGAIAALVLPLQGGCNVEDGDRCGPDMVYNTVDHLCYCADDAIAVEGGCEACPAGDVPDPATQLCVCPAGLARAADGGCEEIAGLGDPCDGSETSCPDAVYDRCAIADDAEAGYCTSSCTSDDDCTPAYTCAVWEEMPYCRTFTGLGDSCTSDEQCTGDAGLCETLQSNTCIIADCDLALSDCPRGTACCDLTAFGIGTACIPPEVCP